MCKVRTQFVAHLPPPYVHSSETDPIPTFSSTVSVDGGADGVKVKPSSSSTSTTTSFSIPITSHVEHVCDNSNKQHEISSNKLPYDVKSSHNFTSTKHNLEPSSSLSNPNPEFSSQQADKTVDYPSSNIYVKIAKPFTNPPPLPMKTELRESHPDIDTKYQHSQEAIVKKQNVSNTVETKDIYDRLHSMLFTRHRSAFM